MPEFGYNATVSKSMEFSKRLKQLRKERGLTLSEISKKAYVPVSSYQEWEQGRKILNVEVYFKLAQILQVSPQFLIFGENQSTSSELQIHLSERLNILIDELQKIRNSLLSESVDKAGENNIKQKLNNIDLGRNLRK